MSAIKDTSLDTVRRFEAASALAIGLLEGLSDAYATAARDSKKGNAGVVAGGICACARDLKWLVVQARERLQKASAESAGRWSNELEREA